MSLCEACGAPLRQGLADWHFECSNCRTEFSTLSPTTGTGGPELDEIGRAAGLRAVRELGLARILEGLRSVRGEARGTLLEVGSAHGWFLEAAASSFDSSLGIEPDDSVRAAPEAPNTRVRAGYFPAALLAEETFDVVAFNDVFEHIRPTDDVAAATARVLQPGGIAVINLPVASGTIYRASKLLYRLGAKKPFERMWQVGFPSPHLYYFSAAGLERVFSRQGLVLADSFRMPALDGKGLWERIRHAEPSLAAAIVSYASLLCLLPVARVVPADVECFLFRRDARARAPAQGSTE